MYISKELYIFRNSSPKVHFSNFGEFVKFWNYLIVLCKSWKFDLINEKSFNSVHTLFSTSQIDWNRFRDVSWLSGIFFTFSVVENGSTRYHIGGLFDQLKPNFPKLVTFKFKSMSYYEKFSGKYIKKKKAQSSRKKLQVGRYPIFEYQIDWKWFWNVCLGDSRIV